MITPDNVMSHELIGLDVTVTGSANRQLIGLNGRVVYETKSMLEIMTGDRTKSIPKGLCTLGFALGGRRVSVDGARISKRPYDRIGAKL